jgi:hypothetical protein
MKPTNQRANTSQGGRRTVTPNTLAMESEIKAQSRNLDCTGAKAPVPIYTPTSIASPGSCPNTSARKLSGTPASGDAANGDSPARWASSISRSIAARVRATTGCARTSPLVIRAAGFERSSEASSPRSSGEVSGGKSTCERSSCRSRCHGSPLFIRDRRG